MELRLRESGEIISEAEFRHRHNDTTLPSTLSAEVCDAFGADIVMAVEPPPAGEFETVERDGTTQNEEGYLVQQWRVVPWTQDEINAYRKKKQAEMWAKIKAERDSRKSGGINVDGLWFHSDAESRMQYSIYLTTIIEKNIPTEYVLREGWKTMSGQKVTMTVGLLRSIRDAGVGMENMLFDAGESHKAAMMLLDDPAAYDFSGGWPPRYEEGL